MNELQISSQRQNNNKRKKMKKKNIKNTQMSHKQAATSFETQTERKRTSVAYSRVFVIGKLHLVIAAAAKLAEQTSKPAASSPLLLE